ncbi:MAG: response regulator [Phycisphaerales bacterium]|nr:response regulator [Phycisphaerales bacterium]
MTPASSPRPPQRIDAKRLGQWLDQLDRESGEGLLGEKRRGDRFRYRAAAITIELPPSGSSTLRDSEGSQLVTATPRNLSKFGIALLVEYFVYPGTSCAVWLCGPHGHTERISGRVIRCRYILGSGCLHEVGVRFARPIDVSIFTHEAVRLKVVVMDSTSDGRRLLAGLLDGEHVELHFATTVSEALEAFGGDPDLVLLELDDVDRDALAVAEHLRVDGYLGPIVGLTAQAGEQTPLRCAEAGVTGYLAKPIVAEDLRLLLGSLRAAPVVSTVAHDQAMAALVDNYIVQLRGWVRELALAHDQDDHVAAAALAQKLRGTAGSYGFGVISEEAAFLEAALAAERPAEEIRAAIRSVLHLCRRARPAPNPLDTLTTIRSPSFAPSITAADGAGPPRPN